MEEEHERDRAHLERQLAEATRAKQEADAMNTRAEEKAAAARARAKQEDAEEKLNQLQYPIYHHHCCHCCHHGH